MKTKKCQFCKAEFTPINSMQKVCGYQCAIDLGVAEKKKEKRRAEVIERRADKVKREKLSPISTFEKRAEKAINAYVRERDSGKGCVSCDKSANWEGQWHASHFRSVGAASAVRFNLWNIHKACWICNKLYSGRIDQYTPEIIQRIGQDRVEWLKSQNQITKYSREWLERAARIFNKKTKRLRSRNAKNVRHVCRIEAATEGTTKADARIRCWRVLRRRRKRRNGADDMQAMRI